MNKLVLSGLVTAIDAIRHTPAGIPLLNLVISHASENVEAGLKRKVVCEINAVILGDLANSPLSVGSEIQAAGFLAKRSAKSSQLVMHIQNLKIL